MRNASESGVWRSPDASASQSGEKAKVLMSFFCSSQQSKPDLSPLSLRTGPYKSCTFEGYLPCSSAGSCGTTALLTDLWIFLPMSFFILIAPGVQTLFILTCHFLHSCLGRMLQKLHKSPVDSLQKKAKSGRISNKSTSSSTPCEFS